MPQSLHIHEICFKTKQNKTKQNKTKQKLTNKQTKNKQYLERDRPTSSALYILWQKQILFFQKIYF